MSQKLASSVSTRLDGQVRRVFSLVLLFSLLELGANAFGQREVLNGWSTLVFTALALLTVMTVAMSWLTKNRGSWFVCHGIAVASTQFIWPLLVISPEALPAGFKPWIWWTIGIGILSFGLFTNWVVGGIFLVGNSIGWFFLYSSEFGGAASIESAIQDSVYLFLFGGSIIGLISLVRSGAKRADLENSKAIASAIEQARIDAVERERQRLDALIHDRVLNTLLLASRAESVEEKQTTKVLAKQAIQSLQEAANEPRPTPNVTPLGLFRALKKAAQQLLPGIEVKTLGGGSESLPAEEAQAITEATIQAIDNAARHAKANHVELILDSPETGVIEVQVRDDGVGFKVDRVPRDRIGISLSVFGRMLAIGGVAKIDSYPGEGTRVLLRWPN